MNPRQCFFPETLASTFLLSLSSSTLLGVDVFSSASVRNFESHISLRGVPSRGWWIIEKLNDNPFFSIIIFSQNFGYPALKISNSKVDMNWIHEKINIRFWLTSLDPLGSLRFCLLKNNLVFETYSKQILSSFCQRFCELVSKKGVDIFFG